MVLVRLDPSGTQLLLVHPGGPFFAKKDEGAWSIPKGLVDEGEDELAAARREVVEELGIAPPEPPFVALGEARLKSGKRVHAWAARGEMDTAALRSNEFELEWPPRSGKRQRFPEVDRAAWVDLETARRLANPALVPLLERAHEASVIAALFGGDGS
ncbi:MAG: NUDIX domain-containing protein [Myxococcota bacterium]|nr:NUDIX domain-containing protein [Myxococcota bacterium]